MLPQVVHCVESSRIRPLNLEESIQFSSGTIGGVPTHSLDGVGRIRSQEWGRQVTLMAVTGWGQDADRTRSRDAGFDHHFVKPADPNVLDALLNSLDGN